MSKLDLGLGYLKIGIKVKAQLRNWEISYGALAKMQT